MKPEEMRTLYEYNAWANGRALQAASLLSKEQYLRKLGSSFSSVKDTLSHIHGAEYVWLERFLGRFPSTFPSDSEFDDIEALKASWAATDQKMLNFVRGLKQEDLDRVMEYRTMKFGTYSNPLWQSMQHVVNHGTYHRGQITTMLRQLGAEPILTDLMHYYREQSLAAKA